MVILIGIELSQAVIERERGREGKSPEIVQNLKNLETDVAVWYFDKLAHTHIRRRTGCPAVAYTHTHTHTHTHTQRQSYSQTHLSTIPTAVMSAGLRMIMMPRDRPQSCAV